MRRSPSVSRAPAPPPSTRITGRGLGLGALALVVTLTGALAAEPNAVRLGLFGLCLLAFTWPMAKRNIRGLTVSRETPPSAFAGQLFPLKLTLTNHNKFDRFSIDLEDGIAGPAERGMHARRLAPGGTATREFETRILRRGVTHRIRAEIASSFPLGLWRTRHELKESLEMSVYPRPVPPRGLEDAQDAALLDVDDTESARRDWSGDFHGIRPFQPGDRLKLIHWPSTARGRSLMVRQFDRRLPEKFSILFHTIRVNRRNDSGGDAFESAMELLCGLLMHCRDRGIPLDLTASFHEWRCFPVPHTGAMDDALALLARARRAPETSPGNLLRAMAGIEAGARVFVLSDVPVSEWAHLLPDMPFEVTCLGVSDLRIKRPPLPLRSTADPHSPAASASS